MSRFGTEWLLIATLTPYLHEWWWALELPAHFHPHIVVAGAGLMLFTFLLKQHIAMFLAALCVVNSGLAIYSVPVNDSAPDAGISVLSQNVSYGNESFEAFLQTVEREQPDIIVLIEYTPEWEAAMDRLPDDYVSRITAPDSGAFGIAILSKLPLEYHEFMYFGQSEVPAIAARFESTDFDGTLIGLHLNPPIGSTWAEDRNIQTGELKDYLLQLGAPFVVVGDFNNTPWSPTFKSFVSETDWYVAKPVLAATWPAKAKRFGIPIDLAVASGDVALGTRETLVLPGSDHFGIRVNVGNQAVNRGQRQDSTAGAAN